MARHGAKPAEQLPATLRRVAQQLRPRKRTSVLDQRIRAADAPPDDANKALVMKAIQLRLVAAREIGRHHKLLPSARVAARDDRLQRPPEPERDCFNQSCR